MSIMRMSIWGYVSAGTHGDCELPNTDADGGKWTGPLPELHLLWCMQAYSGPSLWPQQECLVMKSKPQL